MEHQSPGGCRVTVINHLSVKAAVPMHRVAHDGMAEPVQVPSDLVKPERTHGAKMPEGGKPWFFDVARGRSTGVHCLIIHERVVMMASERHFLQLCGRFFALHETDFLCLTIEQHEEWQTTQNKRSLTVQWKAVRARDSTWDQGRFHPSRRESALTPPSKSSSHP